MPNPKVGLVRTSDDEIIDALDPKKKALTIAAAGVSLSKQTMHRTHDREVETLWAIREPSGSKNPASQLRAMFRYAPFAVGAALIWVCLWGVKRKIAIVRQDAKALKNRVKPIVLLCSKALSGINI